MSKAFGAAGLRLGYLAADPAVVDAVRLVRLPYHLSAVNQATALAALEHTDTLLGYVQQLKDERDRVVEGLRAIGYEVTESDANFAQFGRFADSRAAWRAVLDRGVLIRDNGVPGRLRVSIGTPAENDAFLAAAEAVYKEHAVTGPGGDAPGSVEHAVGGPGSTENSTSEESA
jgi:histidinol-phosphate aminotransferase